MVRQGDKQSACSICEARKKAGTTEVYVISDGADRYFFNVERAKKIVADGRPSIELDSRTIREMLKVNHYDANHLKHVDLSKPGILLQRFGGLILLDGIHRAASCLGGHRKFFVHALTYRESLACLVRQDIASHDPHSIVEKLRKVLERDPEVGTLEAEIECSPKVLKQVRQLLTHEENKRLVLHAIGVH